MSYYAIDSADGSELCSGLPEHTAHRTAQRLADERGDAVYLYRAGGDSEEEEEAEEIAPTEIVVELEGPHGPRVTYGAQDEETVEAEIPDGWSVDWPSAIDLAPSGTRVSDDKQMEPRCPDLEPCELCDTHDCVHDRNQLRHLTQPTAAKRSLLGMVRS